MISTRTTGRVSSFAAAMIVAAVLVAGATAPAHASDPTVETTKPRVAKTAKAKRYCTVELPTGSIVRKKTCYTREEWIASTGDDPALARGK